MLELIDTMGQVDASHPYWQAILYITFCSVALALILTAIGLRQKPKRQEPQEDVDAYWAHVDMETEWARLTTVRQLRARIVSELQDAQFDLWRAQALRAQSRAIYAEQGQLQ
jgi:hypothetical protein